MNFDYRSDFIYENDQFLLCSDGLCGVLTDQDIAEVLIINDVEKANRSLVSRVLAQGAPDNISSVLICLPNYSE